MSCWNSIPKNMPNMNGMMLESMDDKMGWMEEFLIKNYKEY